jgi:hypothetical protein
MTQPTPATTRSARASLDAFTDAELLALRAGLVAVVAAHPGAYGRTRLSSFFAHLPNSCTDEAMSAVALPLELPVPMPSAKALLELVDAIIDDGLLATSPGPRPVLHLTPAGFAWAAHT